MSPACAPLRAITLLLLFLAAALPSRGEGRILLILDDMGHASGTALTEACFTLPREVAFSILPGAPRAARTGRRCLSQGRDQLAHLPWEPLKGEGREPFFMARDAGADHMRRQLERVRRILPGMLGANNHQGSRASADTSFLDTFAQAWAPIGLPFLDSRSTADSRIPQRLGSAGIPVWENHLFLDHVDSDEAIAAELVRLEAWARERDGVIAIAHPRPRTLRLLHAWLAQKPDDLRLVHAHEVLRAPDPWLAGGSFRRPSSLSRAWAGPVEAPAHSPMED